MDGETGRRVRQWTRGEAKDQHLYFTSYSVTEDDRWLVFLSERDGHPNLYGIDRADGRIHRLSRNTSGLLHAYVYPYGKETGLSKASPCLDPIQNRICWIQDDAVWMAVLEVGAQPVKIAELPVGMWTAFTHVSPDGKTICVPVTDERAFDPTMDGQDSQMRDTVARIREHGWKSWILCIDVATGNVTRQIAVPFWVTHVQWDPEGSGRILFNMEGGSIVRPRIWCLETDDSYRPLYDPDAENVEWDSHENWHPKGGSIIYHGRIDAEPYFAARTWEGDLVYRHFLPKNFDFLHATLTMDGDFILIDQKDGRLSRASPSTGAVEVLCRHDSSSREQDCHVHPITNPNAQSLIFTSDRGGSVNVYETDL